MTLVILTSRSLNYQVELNVFKAIFGMKSLIGKYNIVGVEVNSDLRVTTIHTLTTVARVFAVPKTAKPHVTNAI